MGLLDKLPKTNKVGWPWNEETETSEIKDMEFWPKISIITPNFNKGKYIEETIRSILLQNYPNIEYIIIDGLSTDGSLEVINKYNNFINFWSSEKDDGQAHAIIKGIEKSNGIILNWINSDDILYPNALFNIANSFISNPKIEFVYGINGVISESSELISFMPHPNDNLEIRYLFEMPYGQQSCFFKRSIYLKVGGINKNIEFSMDFELYIKMHLFGINILKINNIIGSIRHYDSTKTSTLRNIMYLENGNIFVTLLESFGDNKNVKFFQSLGFKSYNQFIVNKMITKEQVKLAILNYLKKNIWYYYNEGDFQNAKKIALKIIKMEFFNLFEFSYLKVIKDGFLK